MQDIMQSKHFKANRTKISHNFNSYDLKYANYSCCKNDTLMFSSKSPFLKFREIFLLNCLITYKFCGITDYIHKAERNFFCNFSDEKQHK